MGVKVSAAGKILLTAAGLLRLCNCCTTARYWRACACATGAATNYWFDTLGYAGVTLAFQVPALGYACVSADASSESAASPPTGAIVITPTMIDEGNLYTCCVCERSDDAGGGGCDIETLRTSELAAGKQPRCCGRWGDCEYRVYRGTYRRWLECQSAAGVPTGAASEVVVDEPPQWSAWTRMNSQADCGHPSTITTAATVHTTETTTSQTGESTRDLEHKYAYHCGGCDSLSEQNLTSPPLFEGSDDPGFMGNLNKTYDHSYSSSIVCLGISHSFTFETIEYRAIEVRCPNGYSRPCISCLGELVQVPGSGPIGSGLP